MAAEEEQEHLPSRVEPCPPRQGQLFPTELVELEKARIASFDRRTDVAKAAIDANRESEKEIYAYHMKRLETLDAQNQREHRFASRFVWSCLGIAVIFVAGLTWMTFYGSPSQQAMALAMLTNTYKGAAGAGIFVLLRQFWRRLFPRPPEE